MVEATYPNAALREFLQQYFSSGTQLASLRYHICIQAIKLPLIAFLRGGPTAIPPPLPNDGELRAIFHSEKNDRGFLSNIASKYSWDNSKMAAEFVTLLCTDMSDVAARIRSAAFNSRSLGGLPTLAQIRMEPSASLHAAVIKAIAVQQGGKAARAFHGGRTLPASTTCLCVSLVDVAMLKAREQYNQSVVHYKSYGHDFVLLVDGSGVGLYQAWGDERPPGTSTPTGTTDSFGAIVASGPPASTGTTLGTTCTGTPGGESPRAVAPGHITLAESVDRWTSPMSFEDALIFARRFDMFCERSTWDDAANDLYDKLFGVDMAALAAKTGLPPPARIKSWVRVLEVGGVTARRVTDNASLFL